MRFLFIKTGINLEDAAFYDMGVASISAVIKEAGHETSFFYLEKWEMLQNLYHRIDTFKPDIIGFSSPSCTFDIFVKLSKLVKKRNPNIYLILGGFHATLCPEECMSKGSFDAISLGEGEYSILETLEKFKKTKKWYEGIRGMWFREGKEIIKNPNRGMVENLNELPDPDWDIFLKEDCLFARFDYGDGKRMEFMMSRGCPFDCTYCSNTSVRKFYGCTKVRRLSVDRAIDQIKKARELYRLDYVTFDDDILTYDIEWSKQFLNRYKKEIGLPFECNLRVGPFSSKEMLVMLKEAGCVEVKYGLESGNRGLREKVLNRRMTDDQIIKDIHAANKLGLRTVAYVMIGLPEETPEKFIDSIRLMIKLRLSRYLLYVFSPYRGTVLYDVCVKNGYINKKRKDVSERRDTVLDLPTFKREDILYFYRNIDQILKFGLAEGNFFKRKYRRLCYKLYLFYPSHWFYYVSRFLLVLFRAPVVFGSAVREVLNG